MLMAWGCVVAKVRLAKMIDDECDFLFVRHSFMRLLHCNVDELGLPCSTRMLIHSNVERESVLAKNLEIGREVLAQNKAFELFLVVYCLEQEPEAFDSLPGFSSGCFFD